MSRAEDDLRDASIALLRSPACRDIRFAVAGVTIMAYGYGYVADMLERGVVKVRIRNTGTFTAQYDMSVNTLFFGSAPSNPASASERGTIVHECTHAVIDAVAKGRALEFADSEVAAYLAETLYAINSGDPVNKIGPFAGPLYQLASKIRGSAPVYACQPNETSALKPMILWMYGAHAQYAGKRLPQFVYPDGIL